tara:strand:- start:2715 stop:4064 length:1350 start_codon:yes stop_codon:yes gene_type:complete
MKKKLFIVFFFLVVLLVTSYQNKSYILAKGYQLTPNLMDKLRFYYFNFPNKIPSLPSSTPVENDLKIKKNLEKLRYNISHSEEIEIFGDLKKVNFYMPDKNTLLSGISNKYAGSAYIELYNENLLLLSSRGLTAFGKIKKEKITLNQIQNNLNDFLGVDKFIEDRSYSFKDIHVFDNKIFVSFTDEIKINCWSTSIVYADLNFKNLKFKYLFKSDECIDENNGEGFVSIQSGGRIASLDKDHILLTTGEYRLRKKAQDYLSVFGKIIKININSKKFNIVSMGHRNPQGLFVDKKNDIILSTEHGPRGGDEINLINIENIRKNIIPNFGWPISSYGEHYAKKDKNDKRPEIIELYKKYPLYKSHKKYGFIEPIYSFTPSIGISELVGIGDSRYISSSLGGKKLFFFKLKDKTINENYLKSIGERVRDMIYKNNKLILFLEDTATIAIIHF